MKKSYTLSYHDHYKVIIDQSYASVKDINIFRMI